MKTIQFALTAFMFVMAGYAATSQAEDIDIYSSQNLDGAPNLMFVVDNPSSQNNNADACTYSAAVIALVGGSSAPSNDTKALGQDQCALANIVADLSLKADGTAAVKLGITTMAGIYFKLTPIDDAVYTGTNTPPGLVSGTTTNRQAFILAVKALAPASGSSGQGSELQETWAYYTGGNGTSTVDGASVNTAIGNLSGTTYTNSSTNATSGCQKNYIIFLSNADNANASHVQGSTAEMNKLIASVNNATTLTAAQKTALKLQLPNMPAPMGNAEWGREWARFMKSTDINTTADGTGLQAVITYSVATGEGVAVPITSVMEQYIKEVALYGGGKYFPAGTSATNLQNAIKKILNEVQAVNSVFSSSSLPVSVNAQGTYLNQIYMGMFRPDPEGNPRWVGNLKQYHFTATRDAATHLITLSLSDSLDASAINPATGFIAPGAVSYWTCGGSPSQRTCDPVNDVTNGFWINNPQGSGLAYDLPDGELVDKGGAAQVVRLANLIDNYALTPGTPSTITAKAITTPGNPRHLYTYCPSGASCVASLSNTANAFDTSNSAITDAMLGTGPRTIINPNGITSAATATPTSTVAVNYAAGISATPASISITNFAKASSTVTATLSAADFAKISATSAITVAIGSTKVDCSSCTITSKDSATNTLTYTVVGGTGSLPATATATITNPISSAAYSIVTVNKASHGLSLGKKITFASTTSTAPCTVLTALNNTIQTITSITTDSFTITISPSALSGTDTNCKYSPNIATVTTSTSHGFTSGSLVTIAGAGGSTTAPYTGYNGSWAVTNTGATTFTFEYTAAAPLATFSATGGTASSSATTRDALLKWVRGYDNFGDESGPGNGVNIRPSLHGDVLHSRPVAVNYGSYSVSITATSDSGTTRTATASAADVAIIKNSAITPIVKFANGDSCSVAVTAGATPTTFTYSTTSCGATGAQTALVSSSSRVVVYYGGNDGVFRAVNGNQTTAITAGAESVPPGGELWGFIPTEFYKPNDNDKLKRLHDNSPILRLPTTDMTIVPTPRHKDYFADGSTGIYQKLNSDGSTNLAYLYLSMRRGGRFMYALNVTDPAAPAFLWKIEPTGLTNSGGFTASTNFAELGQTWSAPKVALIKGYCGAGITCSAVNLPVPVLIFGAGYDTNQDNPIYPATNEPGADSMGRGIFIVDAATGALVWKATYGATPNCNIPASCACAGVGVSPGICTVAGMDYSIPADITLMDSDFDGYIDRLYAVDVGGNVWRVDIQREGNTTHNTPDYWRVNKVASLGGTGTLRKFFYPADVLHVANDDPSLAYDAVIAGTGDREHPLLINTAAADKQNRIFMLRDITGNDGSGLTTIVRGKLVNATNTAYTGLEQDSSDGTTTNKGYYIDLLDGEKVVNAPLTVAGSTYFGTNQPTSSTSCSGNLGIARGYKLNPLTGTKTSVIFAGGGLPPSPVAGVVSVTVTGETTPSLVPFIIGGGGDPACVGADCSSALGGSKPTINVPTSRTRTYWYQEVD